MSAIKIVSGKKVSAKTQSRVRQSLPGLVGRIVVVRTLFGTFIGCLRSVSRVSIRLRVFSGVDRRFVTITIPIAVIFDIFRFPCP